MAAQLKGRKMGTLYEVTMIQKHSEYETVRADSPEEAAAIASVYSDHFFCDKNLEYIVEEFDGIDDGPEEDEDNGILTNADNAELPKSREYHVNYHVYIM